MDSVPARNESSEGDSRNYLSFSLSRIDEQHARDPDSLDVNSFHAIIEPRGSRGPWWVAGCSGVGGSDQPRLAWG